MNSTPWFVVVAVTAVVAAGLGLGGLDEAPLTMQSAASGTDVVDDDPAEVDDGEGLALETAEATDTAAPVEQSTPVEPTDVSEVPDAPQKPEAADEDDPGDESDDLQENEEATQAGNDESSTADRGSEERPNSHGKRVSEFARTTELTGCEKGHAVAAVAKGLDPSEAKPCGGNGRARGQAKDDDRGARNDRGQGRGKARRDG